MGGNNWVLIMEKAKKVKSVEEFNSGLSIEIAKLEQRLAELKKSYKSEAVKPQATLQECIAMNRKAKGLIKIKEDSRKPKTNSL